MTPELETRNLPAGRQDSKPLCTLVCVGSELLRGKANSHGPYLARQLARMGLELHAETTVRDEMRVMARTISRCLDESQVVFVTGGLGPTFDDLTREAAAEATGRPLQFSKTLFQEIRAKFRHARFRMPPANARQAYLLEGARAIPNTVGTAPGQILFLHPHPLPSPLEGEGVRVRGSKGEGEPNSNRVLILLPGPPRELNPMLEKYVLPALRKTFPIQPHVEAHLHFVGVPESVVDHKIRPLIARQPQDKDIQFTILAHLGLVDLDIFVSDASVSRARRTLARLVALVRNLLGDAWYGTDEDYPLEKVVRDHFRDHHATLAVAESCTGGMLASRLTDVPGSSDYFVEGWVTYANSAKANALGIPPYLLLKYGAVSRPVALAMARGAREHAGTTWGLGITGIAGPGGGTPQKPVGLVFIALASQKRAQCRRYQFSGDRDAVRQRTVVAALDLLRRT